MTDIVIGGGGIIGFSAALELKRSGFKVKLIERGRFMAEASWAAAGMLAAEDPENPPEIAALARLSRELYPEFLRSIAGLSGHPVPLRTLGTLQATLPQGRFNCNLSQTRLAIGTPEAARRIPGLSPGDRSFLWLEEASLDPRDLCAALPAAAAAAGIVLEEQTEILAVDGSASSVEITTSAGRLSAGAFLNCCGAWASQLHDSSQAVEPRKGQMVTVRLRGSPGRGLGLGYVLRAPDVYLVPRGDGRVVIGATVERAGFDRQVDSAATEGLLALAGALWPPIAAAPIMERWAGLRPGTSDGLPLIGRSAMPNCWLATGHFRNGILLAPATGFVLRQAIEGGAPAVSLDPFSVERLDGCPIHGKS